MTSFAIVRPCLDRWQSPTSVLICERPSLHDAERVAELYLPTFPDLRIERWSDSDYVKLPDGSKKWQKWQETEIVRTYEVSK